MKAAIFHPGAGAAIRSFPKDVRAGAWQGYLRLAERRDSGYASLLAHAFYRAWRRGIRDRSGIYRAFYFVRSLRGILIFHVFVKKGQATPVRELGKETLKGVAP